VSRAALARVVAEVVDSAPFKLSPSRVQLSAAVLNRLGPLTDQAERDVLRAITALGHTPKPAQEAGRFLLEREFPGLVAWRLWGIGGGSKGRIVTGSPEWEGRSGSEVATLLRPRLDHGTPEVRRALLEDRLADGLRGLGFKVQRGRRTRASDLWAWVAGVWVNLECRNRVWEVLNQLGKSDREIFPELAAEGHPSVVVTGAVTHRLRQEVERWTSGLGSVVTIGCCVVRDDEAVANLEDWSPWSLMTRLPDVAVFAVADELDRVAAEWRSGQRRQDASNVIEMASRVDWSQDGQQVEPGAVPGAREAVVLSMKGRVRSGEAELLLAAIRTYRDDYPGCRQSDVARALGISVRTLQRVWASSGERWTWAVS
jgi:hypothetical protein